MTESEFRKKYCPSGIRCTVCGKFISYADLDNETARVQLVQPDNAFGGEIYERLCRVCLAKEKTR